MKITIPKDKIVGNIKALISDVSNIYPLPRSFNDAEQTVTYTINRVPKDLFTIENLALVQSVVGSEITEIDLYVEVDKSKLDVVVAQKEIVNEDETTSLIDVAAREAFQYVEGKTKAIIRLVRAGNNKNVNANNLPAITEFMQYYTILGASDVVTQTGREMRLQTEEYLVEV